MERKKLMEAQAQKSSDFILGKYQQEIIQVEE
jgi:hypothetical protein